MAAQKPAFAGHFRVAKEKAKMVNEKKIAVKEHAPRAQTATCDDRNCAVHGGLKTRGRVFEGKVISDKMQKTVAVEWPRLFYIPKFERYEKRRSRVKAHLSPCIVAKVGDMVKIAECRPIAKTVKFVVLEKL